MHKFKRDTLLINFNPYFVRVNKIHSQSTRFSETKYYIKIVGVNLFKIYLYIKKYDFF